MKRFLIIYVVNNSFFVQVLDYFTNNAEL